MQADSGEALGAWVSPSATVEEAYLTGKILRYFGSNNVDYRLRRRDFRGQEAEATIPVLGLQVADIEDLKSILVVGSNLRKEVPLLAHRVRKAAVGGADVSFINAEEYEYLFPVAQHVVNSDADFRCRVDGGEQWRPAETQKAIVDSLANSSDGIGRQFVGQEAISDISWSHGAEASGLRRDLAGCT